MNADEIVISDTENKKIMSDNIDENHFDSQISLL